MKYSWQGKQKSRYSKYIIEKDRVDNINRKIDIRDM